MCHKSRRKIVQPFPDCQPISVNVYGEGHTCPFTRRITINGDPKYHYEHKFQLSLHHVQQPALVDSHASVDLQHFELCGVATSMDTMLIISPATLVSLYLRWPFFYSNSDLHQFLEHIANRYPNLESLVISWPHCKYTDLDQPQLDDFIITLCTSTKNLKKLVLRGFNHVNLRLLEVSFCKFTIEATNLQVLKFDDCEFVDDVTIQSNSHYIMYTAANAEGHWLMCAW